MGQPAAILSRQSVQVDDSFCQSPASVDDRAKENATETLRITLLGDMRVLAEKKHARPKGDCVLDCPLVLVSCIYFFFLHSFLSRAFGMVASYMLNDISKGSCTATHKSNTSRLTTSFHGSNTVDKLKKQFRSQ